MKLLKLTYKKKTLHDL